MFSRAKNRRAKTARAHSVRTRRAAHLVRRPFEFSARNSRKIMANLI
jgi:hypothetical protein